MTIDKREQPLRILLLLLGAAALVAGLYGRFAGLGAWPLGVDEFYISRSIDNVMRSGVPAFPCGGYYTRGIAYQYVVALLRWCGATPEFAGRVLPAMTSLVVLPAAFAVARRLDAPRGAPPGGPSGGPCPGLLDGRLAGWLTVIILCASIWEIEMARFGRMYAPFQAVFTVYLLYFVRYTVDRDDAALKWLVGLSVLGVLTWEGGALIGVANLLAVLWRQRQGRLGAAEWRRLAAFVVLLALLYAATRDLRGLAEAPPGPYDTPEPGHLHGLVLWLGVLRAHPLGSLGSVLPAALAGVALAAIRPYRSRPLLWAGLVVAWCAAALHLFTLSLGVLASLALLGLIERREIVALAPRYGAAIAAWLVFWVAFDHGWSPEPVVAGVPRVIHDLFGLPDVYDVVMRPWGRTLPLLSAALGAAVLYAGARVVFEGADDRDSAVAALIPTPTPMQVLLSLLCVMVLAVGASATDRLETRYTFFLYPLLIALAVTTVLRLTGAGRARGWKLAASSLVPLLCFAASEDFQPRHIANIDTAAVTFRVGMTPARAAHYYPRNDMRVVAEWLDAHTVAGDVVASGIPNLDQYYHRLDYVFLDDDDPRYEAFVCRDGRTERWGNHRVVYTSHALAPVVASGHRVLVAVWPDAEAHLYSVAAAEGWSITRLWHTDSGNTRVLLIAPKQAT